MSWSNAAFQKVYPLEEQATFLSLCRLYLQGLKFFVVLEELGNFVASCIVFTVVPIERGRAS